MSSLMIILSSIDFAHIKMSTTTEIILSFFVLTNVDLSKYLSKNKKYMYFTFETFGKNHHTGCSGNSELAASINQLHFFFRGIG